MLFLSWTCGLCSTYTYEEGRSRRARLGQPARSTAEEAEPVVVTHATRSRLLDVTLVIQPGSGLSCAQRCSGHFSYLVLCEVFALCLPLCPCLPLLLFLSPSPRLAFSKRVVLGSVPWVLQKAGVAILLCCQHPPRPAEASKPACFLPFLLSACLSFPATSGRMLTHTTRLEVEPPQRRSQIVGNLPLQDGC